ncbi:MAG: S9 family peptidase, partial [Brevundimonas sp.]
MMRVLLSILALAAASPAVAQTWPHPEDIPHPQPVSVPLAGSLPVDVTRYLLAAGPEDASLSPDGRWIAFVSRVTGQPQLWVVDAAGGAPRQLTYGLGVDGALWLPDGSAILYGADKGGNERYGFYSVTPDGRREREVVTQSDAFTFLGDFTADGTGLIYATTAGGRDGFELRRAALDGSGSQHVTNGRLGLYPASAQPHGTLLLMQEARGEASSDVSVLDLATGQERTLFKPNTPSTHGSFAWAPDGSGFYMLSNEDRDFAAVFHHDLASGRTRLIAAPDHDVVAVDLSPDGRFLVWTTDEGGYHALHGRDLSTGRDLQTPSLPRGNYSLD